MKELSIEEKARRYDEVKYIMKEYLESGNAGVIAENTIKKAFPELSESDDERIRKDIVFYIAAHHKDDGEKARWLYWLEKQGGQKPDTNCLLSWSETDEKMLQSLEGIVKDYWAKAEQEKNEIKIREASNVSYFLKTIQKSPLCWIKCSDGLPNRDGIYLVVTDGLHNEVYDMARYDSIEGWHKASEIIYWMPIPQLNNKSIIEQKLADNIEKPWSEDDNKHFERILKELENQWQRPSNRPYLDEIVSDYYWLNSIKDRVQPQPKWSEKDEKDVAVLEAYIRSKDWSERHIDRALGIVDELVNKVKSPRPQSQWKPSEQQLKTLQVAIDIIGEETLTGTDLKELLEQLKKLREE